MRFLFYITVFIFSLLSPFSIGAVSIGTVMAADEVNAFRATDLPLPRFVSLKTDVVNVRAGPAKRYPVKWIYQRKNLPVEIVQEFDHWRKIRDYDGETGWVHKLLVSGKRYGLTQAQDVAYMYDKPSEDSRIKAKIEPQVVVVLEQCTPNWCEVEVDGFKGWVQRKFLWGIYAHEEFN